jgi:hypothetical protein
MRAAHRQRLPVTPGNGADTWAGILARLHPPPGLPACDRSGVLPESSGLQQRGLHRNDRSGCAPSSVTGFPFNAIPGREWAHPRSRYYTDEGGGASFAETC